VTTATHHSLTHRQLVDLVCDWRRTPKRLVFGECKLGSDWLHDGVPVADVLTLDVHYRQPLPTIYEVKASRSDFLADTNDGKWRKYLPYASRLYFAVPVGLVSKDDVPAECGLVTYNADHRTWRVVKGAPVRSVELADEVWLSILYRQREEAVHVRDLAERIRYVENAGLNGIAKDLGADVRRKLIELDDTLRHAKADREWARQHLEAIAREREEHRRRLASERAQEAEELIAHMRRAADALRSGTPQVIETFLRGHVVGYQPEEGRG